MVLTERGQRSGRHLAPGLRLTLIACFVILGTVPAITAAVPASADPSRPNTVPDAGARPVPAGGLRLPGDPVTPATGASSPGATSLTGPLATQVYAREAEVALLGDQLLKLREQQASVTAAFAVTDQVLRDAREALAEANASVETVADVVWKQAAEMPPGMLGSDLHSLVDLARLQRGQSASAHSGAAAEAAAASDAVEAAEAAFQQARATADAVALRYETLTATYEQRATALLALKQQNAAQLAEIERQREAADARTGAAFVGGVTAAGKAAHPRALAAVRFALDQLGKPYLWAAEGPDRYDCSGLIWAAYRSKGADYAQLPRVSRDQYYATRGRTVAPAALLPGDLVFFASGTSWTTIHHMGMYIGGGKMVHSPTTGDVVKVSTVWWSHFFAATRVIGEVPAPTASPTPRPSPAPTKTTPPRPSPSPTPSPSKTPSATPSPSKTPSPAPSASTSPTPQPSLSATSAATPTPDPTPTMSPASGGGSPSTSITPTGGR